MYTICHFSSKKVLALTLIFFCNAFVSSVCHKHLSFSTVEFTCKGFPGPGVTLPMARNPMFEFVGAQGYKEEHHSHKVDSDFEEFKGQHGRDYDCEKEEAKRKTHFRHNHRWADPHTLTHSFCTAYHFLAYTRHS